MSENSLNPLFTRVKALSKLETRMVSAHIRHELRSFCAYSGLSWMDYQVCASESSANRATSAFLKRLPLPDVSVSILERKSAPIAASLSLVLTASQPVLVFADNLLDTPAQHPPIESTTVSSTGNSCSMWFNTAEGAVYDCKTPVATQTGQVTEPVDIAVPKLQEQPKISVSALEDSSAVTSTVNPIVPAVTNAKNSEPEQEQPLNNHSNPVEDEIGSYFLPVNNPYTFLQEALNPAVAPEVVQSLPDVQQQLQPLLPQVTNDPAPEATHDFMNASPDAPVTSEVAPSPSALNPHEFLPMQASKSSNGWDEDPPVPTVQAQGDIVELQAKPVETAALDSPSPAPVVQPEASSLTEKKAPQAVVVPQSQPVSKTQDSSAMDVVIFRSTEKPEILTFQAKKSPEPGTVVVSSVSVVKSQETQPEKPQSEVSVAKVEPNKASAPPVDVATPQEAEPVAVTTVSATKKADNPSDFVTAETKSPTSVSAPSAPAVIPVSLPQSETPKPTNKSDVWPRNPVSFVIKRVVKLLQWLFG